MQKENHLRFIQDKIQAFGTAIFRAEMDAELQLPNNIVSTLKTDDDGNIWFLTSCNGVYATHFDKHFFAHLDYYQKGQPCYLRLNGKATIAENSDTGATPEVDGYANFVLIKFKILHAEYCENRPAVNESVKAKLRSFFAEIFQSHGSSRMYDFT